MKEVKCLLPVLIDKYNSDAFMNGSDRITQASLSEQTGIAASTINRLYNGTARRFDAHVIERLCEFFSCDVGDLFALAEVREAA